MGSAPRDGDPTTSTPSPPRKGIQWDSSVATNILSHGRHQEEDVFYESRDG